MTVEEIAALQMGDIIMFPNSKYAEVRSTNNVDKTISLHMLSGTESSAVGDVPPENQDMDTLCVCLWADLNTAEFVSNAPPLARKASVPFIDKLEPMELPRKRVIVRDARIPETLAAPMPLHPGDELSPAGTALNLPLEQPEVPGPPNPIPPV